VKIFLFIAKMVNILLRILQKYSFRISVAQKFIPFPDGALSVGKSDAPLFLFAPPFGAGVFKFKDPPLDLVVS
jgi:hypothetical protein